MKLARRTVSKTLIREQKVFATLPFPTGAAVRFLLAAKLRNEFYPTSSAPPYDTKLSAKFHRSRSSWKRAEMREAATAHFVTRKPPLGW